MTVNGRAYGGNSSGSADDSLGSVRSFSVGTEDDYSDGYSLFNLTISGSQHPPLLTSLDDVPTTLAEIRSFLGAPLVVQIFGF
jgi:hypothetical protein